MTGLTVRILLLCAVVFAVVYGITRALRASASSKEAQRVADEVRRLREAIEGGAMDAAEYERTIERIRQDCRRLGIEVPDLPSRMPPRGEGDR
jgi:uncharacterized membrane protein